MDIEILKTEATNRLNAGASEEEILQLLRSKGCSKPQSIFILSALLGCNTGDAKRKVHFSATWLDRREADERFHENVEGVIAENKYEDEDLGA
jgi:hypothetical protein